MALRRKAVRDRKELERNFEGTEHQLAKTTIKPIGEHGQPVAIGGQGFVVAQVTGGTEL